MLEIASLAKKFGAVEGGNQSEIWALRPTSLTVRPGEFFSLLGPSGCGKTTLLRLLAGFEEPTEGTIRWSGADLSRTAPADRPFRMVFQRYALFPHLDVFENVAFGLRARREAAAGIPERVREALALVRLEGFDRRAVTTLSGGQAQRVALARALVTRPQVLLLDEPLSALDLQLRREMQTELRALQRSLGITFIFVTHDQEEAFALSDRLAILQQGRVLQVGTPEDVYLRPSSAAVARFVGRVNEVPGAAPGTKSFVRPESVQWTSVGDPGAREVTVLDRRFMGTAEEYRVRLTEGGEWIVHAPAAAAVGTSAWVRFAESDRVSVPELTE